ncbi:chaperonin-like RBCX protein 1, chloroplastic isoform X2 [Impatiens glandulifera]|uniref:chaperonin-like RBCX protein 1, chloroplastic isoform X2 n=1 Tax=Impatiens glandulifera TaxID=253017 RepID=UPI001FB14D89|nr:chaperonin-like RBCX protein 1, chloroplastic isoform X2 [Impatiens glandulifera]
MDLSTLSPFSHSSNLLPPKNAGSRRGTGSAFKQTANRRRAARIHCQKMYVPGFGEASPEAKAAKNLHNFFTYVAVRIVQAQLESYNPEANVDLKQFLENHSINDGDKFCAELMRESPHHKTLALRVMEVRSAYCKNDFEWDNLQRLANGYRIKHKTDDGLCCGDQPCRKG